MFYFIYIYCNSRVGNGGRPWSQVVWSVAAGPNNNSSLTAVGAILGSSGGSLGKITIPGYLFNFTTYTFTLSLSNWLGGTGAQSASVTKSNSGDVPTASILGPLSLTVFVSDTLAITAQGQPSSCSLSTALTYSWKVYKEYVLDLSLQSSSADPRKLKLNPYSLLPGTTYQCQASVVSDSGGVATVMAQVYVAPREIAVLVAGGYVRSSPVNRPLLLDASRSADMNLDPALNLPSTLTFAWKCTVASAQSFGSPCDYIFAPSSQLNGSAITVTNMTYGYQYTVSVVCGTKLLRDGRTGSASVSLTPTAPGAGVVQVMQSSATEFNANARLKIGARISAADAQTGAPKTISLSAFEDKNEQNYFY